MPSMIAHETQWAAVPRRDYRMAGIAVLVWVTFAGAVYLPDLGRGFLRDDFGWIAAGRDALVRPATIIRPETAGFYRPLVTVSFAADYVRSGLNARAYGFTNLLLYVACAVLVVVLFQQVGLNIAAAAVGALVWALNPHGINMALLWISGRTSLLLTLFALLATLAFLRNQRIAGCLLLTCALLSKEEATLLPLMLVVWLVCLRPVSRHVLVLDVVGMLLALGTYLLLRHQTPAFTFSTAPWFYRPTTDLRMLGRNALEYFDRGATAATVIGLLAAGIYRHQIVLNSRRRRLFVCGAVWFVLGYALTLWIPVRSSLYAVFPSVGAALACGVVIDCLRSSPPTSQRDLAFAAVLFSSLLLIPAYWVRDSPWVEPARVSNRVVKAIVADADGLPDRGSIILEDTDRAGTADFASVFSGGSMNAVRLLTGRPFDVHIQETSNGALSNTRDQSLEHVVARYRIDNGRIIRVR